MGWILEKQRKGLGEVSFFNCKTSPAKFFLCLNVQVWQVLLAVRALVLPPTEDVETWLEFASLCQRSGRISQARSTLVKLLQVYLANISDKDVKFETCTHSCFFN